MQRARPPTVRMSEANGSYVPHPTGRAVRSRAARTPTTIAVYAGAATQVAGPAVAEDAAASGQAPHTAGADPLTRPAKATELGVTEYTLTHGHFNPDLHQGKPRNYFTKVRPKEACTALPREGLEGKDSFAYK